MKAGASRFYFYVLTSRGFTDIIMLEKFVYDVYFQNRK